MLNKCANPACDTPFRYLRDGRVFRVEREPGADSRPAHNVEHFWLCGDCSRSLTLTVDERGEVKVVAQRGREAA